MDVVVDVYRATNQFPDTEKFGLVSQMRRAAVSVPSNIAESYGRNSQGAFCQHLRIAKGSINELETLLEVSERLNFISEPKDIRSKIVRVGQMLLGLIRNTEGSVVREIESLYDEFEPSDE